MTRTTKQSWWMRAFLTFFVFQMALVLPIQTQANVLDILAKLGPPPPSGAGLDNYIAPLKLGMLPPIVTAIDKCDLGSDTGIANCANEILKSDAGSELGGGTAAQISSMLEIYLDLRGGDIAELFNDVIQLAAGQSPLDLACSVITFVAGGFPVCDALKLLYDIGKAAYEVGKAVVNALADVGCAIYEFFGGSCGNERKVGSVEFVAIGFESSPGLPASLQARVSGQAAWDAHKKEVFAKAQAPFTKKQLAEASIGVGGSAYLYSTPNLEAAWKFYSEKAVYPPWDELVRSKLLDTRRQALIAVTNSIDDAFRAELLSRAGAYAPAAADFARQQAVKTKLDACNSTDVSVGTGVKEWIAAGRAKPAEAKAQTELTCSHLVSAKAMPRPICQNDGVATVTGRCTTTNGVDVCKSIQAVVGKVIDRCYLDEKSPAGIAAAKEASAKNYKQTVDEIKKPCSDTACGTQIVQMFERCRDGKGPMDGSGEFAPLTNREEACGTSYKLIHKLSNARLVIEAHAESEKKRVLAISCNKKAACEESAKKQESDLVSAFSTFRQQTMATLLQYGVVRSSANKATTEADQKIAQLQASKFEMSAVLAGTLVAMEQDPKTGSVPSGLGKGVIATAPGVAAALASGASSSLSSAKGGSATPPNTGSAPSSNIPKPGGLGLSAPVPSTPKVDEAALKTCKAFLGRKDEMLCNDARSFAACKTAVDIGQMKTCRITGSSDVYPKR